MEMLRKLVDDIREETCGAMHYAKLSHKTKETDPGASTTYAEMARQELDHGKKLCTMAKEYLHKHETDPEYPAMKIIWDWEKERITDDDAKVRQMLEMVRG